jgi:hypothetical protein
MEEIRQRIDVALLRIVAFALDAAVEAGLPISEEQYETLLLEAGRRMNSSTYAPAYPEALERAARRFVDGRRAARTDVDQAGTGRKRR